MTLLVVGHVLLLMVYVVGMLMTPPDVFSQTLLAVPMYALFELGLLFSRQVSTNRQQTPESEA